jgi:hypothetical protein
VICDARRHAGFSGRHSVRSDQGGRHVRVVWGDLIGMEGSAARISDTRRAVPVSSTMLRRRIALKFPTNLA